jgi:molybdate transport system ATP-binding protein
MTEFDILLKRKNFNIEINERFSSGITGIYGPSGAGKTSLLLAISGLIIPEKGEIMVGGRTLFSSANRINVPVAQRNIGYVFQEGRLFPHMSVAQNLRYGLRKKIKSNVSFEEVVELLDLEAILDRKSTQISGGERQRTALGRSLLSSPDILLLDEPFSAVDVSLRKQILPFIISIQQKVQIPILVVSHDLSDLLKLTNTLFLMEQGKCLGHGNYYELLKKQAITDLFQHGNLINTIEMNLAELNMSKGLASLSVANHTNQVQVKCDSNLEKCAVGQRLKILISADDIALSKNRLEDVSIQNQVAGKVVDIVERGTTLLCIVDAGFKLVVEITVESKKRMQIERGSPVFCLFKSVAIELIA